MKEYTVYELEAGDKLYHVTDDNKIEEITLTDDQLNIEFDRRFCYFLAKANQMKTNQLPLLLKMTLLLY